MSWWKKYKNEDEQLNDIYYYGRKHDDDMLDIIASTSKSLYVTNKALTFRDT